MNLRLATTRKRGLATALATTPAAQPVTTESVLGPRDVRLYAYLCGLWIAANLVFWWWWLQPEHVGTPWLYALFSLAWLYDATFLPSRYLFFVGHMRRPRPMAAPPDMRVALITLCVPEQETLAVIERQLDALAHVAYPHDSWVLDEGNDPQVRAAAAQRGVRYFSRKGLARYNQASGPFTARTKAGNVNAWLEAHGWAYDVFVQFDVDHLPRADYLHRVLGFFRDPRVAWVQAPSLYGNLEQWVARGAAEQELVLQGPLQRGFFGYSQTPFIIGSHCAYRTRAINEIGGFQPTRAEDHLDTVVLAAHGYRGVFVPEPIAIGDGPETFETYLRQQFAWARSMMQVLFGFTPRFVRRHSRRQRAQFLFAQTWYPLWSSSMLVLFVLPLLTLVSGARPARAPLWQFGFASAPLSLGAFIVWRWTRRWQLPRGLGLSWRGMVLHVARWPIVVWALLNVLLRVQHPYMITPKGEHGDLRSFSLRAQLIYLVGAASGLLAVWAYLLTDGDAAVEGYVLFTLLGVVYMLCVVLTNLAADLIGLRRHGVGLARLLRVRLWPLLVMGLFLGSLAATTSVSHETVINAATWMTNDAAGRETTPGPAVAVASEVLEARPLPTHDAESDVPWRPAAVAGAPTRAGDGG